MKHTFSKYMLLLAVLLMDMLGGAELDLIVPSFPELQELFQLSPFWVEMLLSANFIGFCVSLFFVGGLADMYGRKPVIVGGLLMFILGSVSCFFAPAFPFLVIGRFLQGVGVAAPATLCFLIIADNYPLKQQQFLYAVLNGVINLSVGLAPLVGSYVTLYFRWRGNFAVLLILGMVILFITYFFVPAHPRVERKGMLSLRGYLQIFQSRNLRMLLVNFMFMFVPYWIFVGMSPLLYIKELGVSLEMFGYYQGSLAFSWAIGCVGAGWLIKYVDQRKLLLYSGWLCALGLVLVACVSYIDSRSPLMITLAYFPFNLGVVMPSVLLYPVCINYLPEFKGRVSSILTAGRLLLTAVGLEIAGYYYVGSFRSTGIVISIFFIITLVTLFQVIQNRELMAVKEEE